MSLIEELRAAANAKLTPYDVHWEDTDRSRAFCESKRLRYACEINARFHLENGYFHHRQAIQ